MIQYIPIILICASGMTKSECREGARDTTIVVGEPKILPTTCLKEGEERLAQLAFAPRLDEGYYYKVKCVPREGGLQ